MYITYQRQQINVKFKMIKMILLNEISKTCMNASTLVTIQKEGKQGEYFVLMVLFESGVQQSYYYADEESRDKDYNCFV